MMKNLSIRCCQSALRLRLYSSLSSNPEYAFEMAASSIRFGRGSTKEIGFDLLGMGVTKNVCIFTDPHMVNLPPGMIIIAIPKI